MTDAPWKTLLETAKARRQAQRISGLPAEHPDRPSIEQEILSEMAYSLGRAERKLLRAIEAMKAAYDALEGSTAHERPARLSAASARQRQALEARWELVVHREAIGLTQHDEIDELFPIPARPPGE